MTTLSTRLAAIRTLMLIALYASATLALAVLLPASPLLDSTQLPKLLPVPLVLAVLLTLTTRWGQPKRSRSTRFHIARFSRICIAALRATQSLIGRRIANRHTLSIGQRCQPVTMRDAVTQLAFR